MNNNTNSNPNDIPTIVLFDTQPRFETGQVVTTPLAAQKLGLAGLAKVISRHVVGDWGNLPADDLKENEEALTAGGRLLSRYDTRSGSFYVITEADRSYTIVMSVREY